MKNKIYYIILIAVAVIGIISLVALTIYTANAMQHASITAVISNEA
ncbi:MAG: hypothetical protein K6B64_01015 [Acholeplasmatales bacterium]|nr:hypothetical protein [Acholeplasmatales bacterium]